VTGRVVDAGGAGVDDDWTCGLGGWLGLTFFGSAVRLCFSKKEEEESKLYAFGL
jgi:hypothetical protein